MTDLNNNQIDLDSYHGNVLFLNLWATWCKPCIVEFEDIMNSKKLFEKDSIKFVAISNENINTIKSFVLKNKYDIEFLKLEGDYSYFDAYGLPTTIIFDKSGKEIFRTSGMKKNQFTSKSFNIFVTAIENPHCGASGVPFMKRQTSFVSISLLIKSFVC